jgi:type IV pilus assembly protein PilA
MIDWYYHDPAQGRVGPFSAEDLRKRFRDRRIQRDTLVWHHGLREWQPLMQLAEELGLEQVKPDPSQPPLPPPVPGHAVPPPARPAHDAPRAAARTPTRGGKYSRTPLREKKTLSSGAIAGLVAAALGIPGVLVLVCVMLPAYRDYAGRADSVGSIAGASIAMKRMVGNYAMRTGTCPSSEHPKVAQLQAEVRRRTGMRVQFGAVEGGCSFVLTFNADGQPIDGKTLRYEGFPDGNQFAWDCSGGTLPEEYRPYECQG